MATPTNRS
uniref:Uncharacterized protein n=1 Tax=Arundo donax TaxID=35708 RepID=A0A0A9CE77_ARUDO